MLQNATPLRKSAPGPPNSSDEHVSCAAPATENASLQILFKCPTPAIVFGNATKPWRFAHFWQGPQSLAPATRNDVWTSKSGANMWCLVHFWLQNVLRATTACTFSTSQLPKVVRTWCVLCILTSKCAFDISTSKSGPNLVCFVHFDFEMCFAPVIEVRLFDIDMMYIVEGSFDFKLPTIWTDEKQRWEESERREE